MDFFSRLDFTAEKSVASFALFDFYFLNFFVLLI